MASDAVEARSSQTNKKDRPRVTFAVMHKDASVPEAVYSPQADEQTALLTVNTNTNYGQEDANGVMEDGDDRGIRCTVGGILISLLVLFLVTGICALAVSLGVGKNTPHSPHRGPIRPPLPISDLPQLPRNPAFLIRAQHGAVASENKVCSDLGVDILKDGGNAVDAAIGANLCVGTLNMFASGIGGGGFSIVRLPPSANNRKSEAWTVDFREASPALSNETMYKQDANLSKYGGLAVGIPGELKGMEEMHRRWGRLPWSRIVSPSAVLSDGWHVDAELEHRFDTTGRWILKDSDWQPIFAPSGKLLLKGERMSRKAYARTLRIVAEKGAEAFYKGPIAEAIVRKVQSKGGILSLEDMASYKAIVKPALRGTYRGRKIYTTQAPTSGAIVLHMLNILEHYDLIGEGRTPLNIHRLVETLKFGFAARTRLADPAFMKNAADVIHIASKAYAAAIIANLTDDRTHPANYYNPEYDSQEDHGTTHVSVVDRYGMAVGITSSVNLPFGSHILDEETGVIPNDSQDDFSTYRTPDGFGLYPSPYNYPQPGKRPLSSMAPTVIERDDGSLHLVLGGSGGSRIFGSILQVILGVDWGLDISQAIEQPRVHDQLFPPVTTIESMTDPAEVAFLEKIGHQVVVHDINWGVAEVQAVHVAPNGSYFAASDSRKHGIAAGY